MKKSLALTPAAPQREVSGQQTPWLNHHYYRLPGERRKKWERSITSFLNPPRNLTKSHKNAIIPSYNTGKVIHAER